MNKKYKIFSVLMCICFALTHGTLTVHAESSYPWQTVTDMELGRNPYGDNSLFLDFYDPETCYADDYNKGITVFNIWINNPDNARVAMYSKNATYISIMSNTALSYTLYYDIYYYTYNNGAFKRNYTNHTRTLYLDGSVYAYYDYTSDDGHPFNYVYSDVPVFSDKTACKNYCLTGDIDTDKCIYNPNIFEYSEEIYFEEFDMEIHSSNLGSQFFVRFYYKPSQYMIDNGGSCTVEWLWEFESYWFVGIIPSNATYDGSFELDLSQSYVDIYIADILPDSVVDGFIVGKEVGIIDGDDISIDGVGVDSVRCITKSLCYFNFVPSCQGVAGNIFRAVVDCLDPNNSYTSYSEPIIDDNGNYTDDYQTVSDSYNRTEGYYYTNVSQDNYGNNTYNYYFIDSHDISTEISSDGSGTPVVSDRQHIDLNGNVNVNVNLGQDDDTDKIVINDDDYSGSSLIDNVTNLYGLRDDLETAEEDDGALTFLERLLGALPGDLAGMLGYGCSTVVLVAIIRAFLKR